MILTIRFLSTLIDASKITPTSKKYITVKVIPEKYKNHTGTLFNFQE